MKKILVTGAGGFVGKRFMEYNQGRYGLRPLSLRTDRAGNPDLNGIDAIVHFAGKAHDMKMKAGPEYFDVNVGLTRWLAQEAKKAGVPHFIYISSVKVYGDNENEILNEQSPCHPDDDYGKSKLEAEKLLHSLASGQFTIAIVRPPLVYGAGVKGNMIRFLELANKHYPLPFGDTGNLRSMVFLDNLIELINTIIDKRAEGIFIAGDRQPISTDELIRLIRKAMNRKKNMIKIPGFAREIIRKLKPSLFRRLYGSFVIDNSQTNKRLNFTPPYSTEQGIIEMVRWFKSR